MQRFLILAGVAVALFLFLSFVFALGEGIPHLINYQGMLTDDGGNPLNGTYDLTFSFYSVSEGGTAIWSEVHSGVEVGSGLFNVVLGSETTGGIPSSVFESDERYLGIKVGTEDELMPRVQLTSVGYAYLAERTDFALMAASAQSDSDWTISGNNMYSTVTGNVGIGTASPETRLHIISQPMTHDLRLENPGVRKYDLNVDDLGSFGIRDQSASLMRLKINNLGNFGIGTSDPNERMTINGRLSLLETTAPSASSGYGKLWVSSSDSKLYFKDDGGTEYDLTAGGGAGGGWVDDGSVVRLETTTDNVGIGTTSPAYKLDVVGSRMRLRASTAPGAKAFLFRVDGAAVDLNSDNADFFIHSNSGNTVLQNFGGNVGIGTDAPEEKLHVNGNIMLNPEANIIFGDSNTMIYETPYLHTAPTLYFTADDDIVFEPDDDIFIRADEGFTWVKFDNDQMKLGIGTTSPTSQLHVRSDTGEVKIDGNIGGRIIIGDYSGTADKKYFHIQSDGSRLTLGRFFETVDFMWDDIVIDQYGTVRIPQRMVIGNGFNECDGFTCYYDACFHYSVLMDNLTDGGGTDLVIDGDGYIVKKSSSVRYKENIRKLQTDPEEIFQLEPVRFNWKTTGVEDIGLIAEEVEKIIPDLVIYDSEGKPDAVKYDVISLYLLEVVKEQQELLKEQHERISALEKEISVLKR